MTILLSLRLNCNHDSVSSASSRPTTAIVRLRQNSILLNGVVGAEKLKAGVDTSAGVLGYNQVFPLQGADLLSAGMLRKS